MHLAIIFPNQLFEIKYLPYDPSQINHFVIIEDPLFFADKERILHFNMLKLIYQRASMKYYQSYLKNLSHKTIYLEYQSNPKFWINELSKKFTNPVFHIIDPVDHLLRTRINDCTKKYNVVKYESPAFLSTSDILAEYMDSTSQFYQYNFYVWQRKRLNILMSKGKPIGGKYSYDKYNRKPIPGKNLNQFLHDNSIKLKDKNYSNQFYPEAIKYCEAKFTNYYPENYNPDNITLYPITHSDAKNHFQNFLKNKLSYFGDFQDAIDFDHVYMFHSVISPQLNNGLLNPQWVLDKVIDFYDKSSSKKSILHDVEGFIRQLNWREYSRLLYIYAYDDMRSNYFNNDSRLDINWYNGTTGIYPIDQTIKTAFQYGYIHHIQRLMIMTNFMNLCKIHPDDAYKWFMEFSLDSYDWVMINNVYSMGMHADGGLATTKPYISSSNYVLRESNATPDGVWERCWDVLYYYFIYRNYKKLTGRGTIYQSQWDKRTDKNEIISIGKKLIKELTTK